MVGGGFIGLEVAENLCELGVKVTVIQRGNQLLNTLDYDMATLVHSKLRSKGIDLKIGGNVVAFEETENSDRSRGIAFRLGSNVCNNPSLPPSNRTGSEKEAIKFDGERK